MTDNIESPQYVAALINLHMQAALDAPPTFEHVDAVRCEDGVTIMLHGYTADGRCYLTSFIEEEGD